MRSSELVAAVTLLAIIAYGVLAGADFGGGVWDLFARGARKTAQREAIARAMGPVWEANHVWLIFVIVLLFSGFPTAWGAINVALFVPLHLALVGIILRGASFIFRAYGPSSEGRGAWGAVFGAASVVTPFVLGQCLGAVSSGAVRVLDGAVVAAPSSSWCSLLSLAIGALALSVCAYLAAVYLTLETQGDLREDFRRRALASGTVVVALSALLLPLLRARAPHLWSGLLGPRALPVVVVGAVATLASGVFLLLGRFRYARAATVVQVAFLLGGWGLAQHPYILYPDVTLADSAAPEATLRWLLLSLLPGGAMLIPSLVLLFRVFKGAGTTPPA